MDPIAKIGTVGITDVIPEPVPKTFKADNVGNFSDWLGVQVTQANDKIHGADEALQRLAVDPSVSLHETMMTIEKAKLHFEMLVQVRNRAQEAYQEILRMQV